MSGTETVETPVLSEKSARKLADRDRALEIASDLESASSDRRRFELEVHKIARLEADGVEIDRAALASALVAAKMNEDGYVAALKQAEIRRAHRELLGAKEADAVVMADLERKISSEVADLERHRSEKQAEIVAMRERLVEMRAQGGAASRAEAHLIGTAPSDLRDAITEARRVVGAKNRLMTNAQREANASTLAVSDIRTEVDATNEMTPQGKSCRERLVGAEAAMVDADKALASARSEFEKAQATLAESIKACVNF